MSAFKISENIFDCKLCTHRCDGVSKGVYTFSNDVEYSENYENLLIASLNRNEKYLAKKSENHEYPDIEIFNRETEKTSFLEVKVQRRTFMKVQEKMSNSNLYPSETVALNLSDLERYFQLADEKNLQIFIVWGLSERSCIVSEGETYFYYQKLGDLKTIYENEGKRRRFRRQSGDGDVVDGVHKGVTVNYHFSVNELIPWHPKF